MELNHLPQLAGFAAIDSVNILAFAVIAGLWLSQRDRPGAFLPRAAQFTGGAFLGILSLAALSVWVIGSNQELFRSLWRNPIAAVIALIGGVILLVMGLRTPRADAPGDERAVDADVEKGPLPQSALAIAGLFGTGVALGIIQSGTSVPFAAGVVVISFAQTPVAQQLIEILVFALVAILPSALLIGVLSRVRGDRVDRATVAINRFMRRAKALGRALTLAVGAALAILGVVRFVQLGVIG